LFFLEEAASYRTVFLDTEIDMSAVGRDREAASERCSYLAYITHAAARTLRRYSGANAMLLASRWPRLALLPEVDAKITLDKRMNGVRMVASGIIAHADRKDITRIQQNIDELKARDPATDPAYAGLRRLQSLPVPIGRMLYSWLMRSPTRKMRLQGSFAVTSLGNSAVKRFSPMVGATITFGIGNVSPSPVVVDGQVAVRPLLPLTMAFDHRVLDGAMAADLLTELKRRLEAFPEPHGEEI
jgi:pyruvate/2-oxoglutarate dehydrogenase complex dihydrolipoamide acyltransferase (E2) component